MAKQFSDAARITVVAHTSETLSAARFQGVLRSAAAACGDVIRAAIAETRAQLISEGGKLESGNTEQESEANALLDAGQIAEVLTGMRPRVAINNWIRVEDVKPGSWTIQFVVTLPDLRHLLTLLWPGIATKLIEVGARRTLDNLRHGRTKPIPTPLKKRPKRRPGVQRRRREYLRFGIRIGPLEYSREEYHED